MNTFVFFIIAAFLFIISGLMFEYEERERRNKHNNEHKNNIADKNE